MEEWTEHSLDAVCVRITDGAHSSPPTVSIGMPMGSVKDLTPYGVQLETCRRISPEDFEKLVRQGCQPQKGDVLLAKDGATALDTVCEVKKTDDVVLLSSVAILRPNPDIIDSGFLRHYLDSPTTRSYLKGSFISGAAIPRIVLKDLKRATVKHPKLPLQRRIASILSGYDDLIEVNWKRIQILEKMAQLLYRKWFVSYQFPGHEKVNRVPTTLGEIPVGWEVRSLESLIAHHVGGGWGRDIQDEIHTIAAWVIRGTDIPNARYSRVDKVPLRFHSESNLKARRLGAGDIVFEVSGGSKGQPVGRSVLITPELVSNFMGDPAICASFCKRICVNMDIYAPEILYLSFLHGYESGEIEQFQVQSTGISNFKWMEYIGRTLRAVPHKDLQRRFCQLVAPMLSQIGTLGLQIAGLQKTKELLLPRLMTGQLAMLARSANEN